MEKHWIDDLELVENDGCKTWIRKDHWIDLQCIRESITEDQYRLKSLAGKVGYVLDIGACQGVFACRAAQILKYPIISLEPHPENFNILNLNVSHGPWRRIQPILGAFYPGGDRTFLTTHEHEAANHLADHGIPVLGIGAEQISFMIASGHGLDFPPLLKLDFEGGEDLAIREFSKRLNKMYIAGEWHHDPEPVRRALHETGCQNIEVQGVKGDITGLFFATKGV